MALRKAIPDPITKQHLFAVGIPEARVQAVEDEFNADVKSAKELSVDVKWAEECSKDGAATTEIQDMERFATIRISFYGEIKLCRANVVHEGLQGSFLACYPVTCAAILRFAPPAKHLIIVGLVVREYVGHIFHDIILRLWRSPAPSCLYTCLV